MVISLEKWVSWQEYRNSVYVFHEASRKVYIFSGTARTFWISALSCDCMDAVIDQLCFQYGSEFRDAIAEDLIAFLDELKNYGLIREGGYQDESFRY